MRFFVFCFLLFVGLGCQETALNPAFYYWRSVFELDEAERSALTKQAVKRLYVKYFDVAPDVTGKAIPVATLRINQAPPQATEIVPTVFIVNRVFREMPKDKYKETSAELAKNVWSKIQDIHNRWGAQKAEIREVQIDCDWTQGSKEAYFAFLHAFKAQSHKQISVTIRLYQYKNRTESGTPPADRGMLMLYNLTNPRKFGDRNSIFEKEEALKYTKDQPKYPIAMDVVLPIFSWGVAFHNQDFAALLNNFPAVEARKHAFLKEEKPNLFMSRADTVFRNIYFRQGDHIRIEEISQHTLTEAIEIARTLLNSPNSTIALYHLDSNILKHYDHETLQKALRLHF